jgi:hypothetical protein
MIETIIAFMKGFPTLLFHVVEVLIVAVVFSFCVIFLYGIYVGIRIIGKRANKISEITVFPPTIKFRDDERKE